MRRIDVNAIVVPGDGLRLQWCDEAWISHPTARNRRPEALDELMLGSTRELLRPVLVGGPSDIAEIEPRLAAYRAAGAPAVMRLFPGEHGHGYPLEDWALSPIPEFCEAEDLCLVLDFGPVGSAYPWSDLVSFARHHPRLPILATGAPIDGPTAPRALDATPNLLLEVSCETETEEAAALPALAASHGAYRLAYGSGRGGHSDAAFAALDPAQAEIILLTTPSQIAAGTWGATHL